MNRQNANRRIFGTSRALTWLGNRNRDSGRAGESRTLSGALFELTAVGLCRTLLADPDVCAKTSVGEEIAWARRPQHATTG